MAQTASALKGRNMLTRGTSIVIDIHNTSLARPLQIEYPAVLKKTMCFSGAKYNPSPSQLGLQNGSEGGKMGGEESYGATWFSHQRNWGDVEGVSKAHEPCPCH